MKRLAPAPGARKLNLAAARRRRPMTMADWERADILGRVHSIDHFVTVLRHKLDCLRDESRETWQLAMETRHELRHRLNAVNWAVRLVFSAVASFAAVAAVHRLWP